MKFELKIPNRLGKMSENFRGRVLTRAVDRDVYCQTNAASAYSSDTDVQTGGVARINSGGIGCGMGSHGKR